MRFPVMTRSLRLLPFTMVMAFLLLGLTVGDAVRDGHILMLSFTQEAQAQQAASSGAAETKESPKKEEEPKITPPSTTDEENEDTDEPKRKPEFSQVEVDLLQSLAKRRQDLDDWQKKVQLKENMLTATEQRINEKIDSLEKMKKEIEDLLAQYNEQEDTKVRSLVKIYENMKPKDAARIFEELDMPVLLLVVDRMQERKVAPILANMSPEKAKNVTVQLAEQRKLKKPRAAAGLPAADNSAATPDATSASSGASGDATANPPAAAAGR